MTAAPSRPTIPRAVLDAADSVTTISREHVSAILAAGFAALAGDLLLEDHAVRDGDGGTHLWLQYASPRLQALLAALVPAREDVAPEPTLEERFPDWDRTNFMVAGRYFDAEIAPTFGRVPDDISAENLAAQRERYIAATASNLDAAAELQEWDARRRGEIQ